jgi:excisionase family DNA binding protein
MCMGADEKPRLLRVGEVAHLLGEHKVTTYKRIQRGELRALRIGTGLHAPLRVPEDALEELLHPIVGPRREGDT